MARKSRPDNATSPSDFQTKRIQSYDPSVSSPDTQQPWATNPSYLSGVCNTNDVGTPSYPGMVEMSPEDWQARADAREKLRRHTVEQGHATYTKEADFK